MTDKTLGAYTRHKKHDTADFANAEFARHPKGGITMAYARTGRRRWINVRGGELSDAQMAEKGWSPVRECPDPDDHILARDYAAMSDRATAWQKRVEKAEKERDAAQHVLEEHRCGEQAERAYRRAVAVESRALTPDDVRRALDVAVESFASSCPPDDEPHNAWKVRQATWEALRELFPNVPQSAPARPDWAEQIRPILAEYAKESALLPVTAPGLDLADFLAERGVRAPEGGAA